jgi:catalase
MAMMNPKGRVNYEPNSWSTNPGPRESPEKGFHSYPAREEGPKRRIRSETFADHYSQARQFYISQTDVERGHIAAALTFELSKVETPAIRARMVSHLLSIDRGLAEKVAKGLRLREMPQPATAARPTRQDLKPSPALSIQLNGPKSFAGRKVGALVTDGVDAALLAALAAALKAEGAMLKLVAPEVGGIEASDGTWLGADEKLEGGPSVLFDAVALLPSQEGEARLAMRPAARDFVADAVAHQKFIAHVESALPLLAKAGVADNLDDGFVLLTGAPDCDGFAARCRKLRFWGRVVAEP